MPRAARAPGPALVVAVEGLDTAGTSAGCEAIGRWLERKGWRVRFLEAEPSAAVRAAARSAGKRQALTPRVAALLTAAEATARARRVASGLGPDAVLVLDRYAWTAAARAAAHDVELGWAASLHAGCPVPDLVVLVEHPAEAAVEEAVAARGSGRVAPAVAASFGQFLARVADGYRALAASAEAGGPVPWPTQVTRVAAVAGPDGVLEAARRGLRARAAAGPARGKRR